MAFWRGFITGACALALLVLVAAWLRQAQQPAQLLGHQRYRVARSDDLVAVDRKGKVLLARNAARAFQKMQEQAAREGISLVPVSGWRNLTRQKELFFGEASVKGISLTERAHVCAPPGYSEHHTGYSLDVGDGLHRKTQLELSFRETPAFRWLRRNAVKHHFELSFPPGKRRSVAYEPWHWRYVGDIRSFRMFYQARRDRPDWLLP